MAHENVVLPLTGGLDRSRGPLKSDLGTFYDLFNFRHQQGTRGVLEQTPFFNQVTKTQGTYYNGGSLTEPATGSAVRIVRNIFCMTDYVFWNGSGSGGTQHQAFYQTTVPAAESVTTGCFIVINDLTTLAVTLGATFEVRIQTDATHFGWRKNGGAWSADTLITTSGVSVDTGNVTVYFLAAAGFDFATPSTWIWTRLDRSFSDVTYSDSTGPHEMIFYKQSGYFTTTDHRVMHLTSGATNGTYVISAGYRPVYGSYLTVFDDHLVVGKFAKTAGYNYRRDRNRVVGWSDKSDLQNFIPTDTNEADQVTLSFNLTDDTVTYTGSSSFQIAGLAVLGQQLQVVTSLGIHTTSALGLPLVFSFQFSAASRLGGSSGMTVIPADSCIYLIAPHEAFRYDGAMTPLGLAPWATTLTSSFSACQGCYDWQRGELVLMSTSLLTCYQEKHGAWYTRSASFGAALYNTAIFVDSSGNYRIGAGTRAIFAEDATWVAQPVKDYDSGASYATPKITSQLIGGSLRPEKELETVYLGASVVAVSSTYYSTSANAQVQLHWYSSDNGLISGTPATNSSSVWTTASASGLLSPPRVAFRSIALEVQLNGLVALKPPGQVLITSVEALVRTTDSKKPDR